MRIVQAGIVLLLGFWAFSPVLQGEWLFDDIQTVLNNPTVHKSTGLWTIWFAPPGPDYFPLKDTVQWLQWHLWGRNTLGYHLTNITLHLFSALLVWRLLERVGVRLAWLGALLFAVHPITVESVAWICELKNTLSLPFLLMAMLAYLHYDRHLDRISYFRSAIAFLAALLCKTSVVMFPVIILLYGWWRYGHIRAEDWKRSAVFFGIALVLGFVTMFFQHGASPGFGSIESLDPFSRLLCAGLIITFYLSKCFWPVDLDIVYFRWNVQAAMGWEIFSWLLLVLFLGWLATRRTSWARNALFAFGFFLVNLVPVLGFIRMIWMSYAWSADHFVYLPLIGLIGLVTAGVGNLHDRFKPARIFLSLVVGGLVLALAFQSHAYAKLYKRSVVLWKYNIRNNPGSWIGYNNLGVALAGEGNPFEAIPYFQRCLEIKPDCPSTYVNLGNALILLGRVHDAIIAYQRALDLQPDYALAHFQMGRALVQTGQLNEAVEQYRILLQINPNDVAAHSNLAYVFIQAGHLQDSVAEARCALQIDPDFPDAHYNLGIALGHMGRIPEAANEFVAAARLNPDDPEIQYNLGIALLMEGKTSEALQRFQEALKLNPQYAAARSAMDRLQNAER